MMKKIKLLVAITFVVAITSVLWKCQPNEDDITILNPVSEQSQRRINKIPFKSLPFGLDNHLNRLSETFNKNRSSSEELLVFDESQIIEVIDSLSNTKYSIKFSIPDQPDNVLYNLVLGVDANNQESNPFILKYTINNPEEVYENLIPDFTKMKGTISEYRLESFLNSLGTRNVEEDPCAEYNVGGGSEDSGSDDNNSGSSDNSGGGGGTSGDPSDQDYNEPGGGDSNGDTTGGSGDIENPDDEPVTCNVLVWYDSDGQEHAISWSCSDGSRGYGDINRSSESNDCAGNGDVGINDGEDVVDGPDDPINNMDDYLNCFSPSQQAKVTIYAEQPDPENPDRDHWKGNVGHSFVTIEQGSNRASYGFYPASGWGLIVPTDGTMGNDQNHVYSVSISINVSGSTLNDLLSFSAQFAANEYDLENSNCTSFAVSVANMIGLNMPISECVGSYGEYGGLVFSGPTPAAMGRYMREMSLPTGATRNTEGGVSPANIECE